MAAIEFAGSPPEELTVREAQVTGLIACVHREATERLIPGVPGARTVSTCGHCGASKIEPGRPRWSLPTVEAARRLGFGVTR
jgi:hypothetical protein